MESPLQKLAGGDRRSIGRSNEVVADVLNDRGLFPALFAGTLVDDPVIRMRAADAVEKITAQAPELLQPYKDLMLNVLPLLNQQEVRWHLAQMLPRLELTPAETEKAYEILRDYLSDDSRIVRTCAMQALTDFAERDRRIRHDTIKLLREVTGKGSPAMRSRGRRLLERLERLD